MLCTSGFVDDVMFYTMDSMARHLYSVTVETTPLSIPAIKTSNYTSWVARMGGGASQLSTIDYLKFIQVLTRRRSESAYIRQVNFVRNNGP